MIFWKDFVLDEVFGPLLVVSESNELGDLGIRKDAFVIQETRQAQRPARMVGLSSLDSAQSHTDVSRGDRANDLRRRGEA